MRSPTSLSRWSRPAEGEGPRIGSGNPPQIQRCQHTIVRTADCWLQQPTTDDTLPLADAAKPSNLLSMNSGLDHLPEGKRRELAYVVETVRAGFADAIAHRTQPRYRAGKLLKIVLFGSYARGDWVEDPVGRYFSDYDLLVVVNHDDLADIAEFWEATENRLLADLSSGTVLRTPVM